MIIARCVASEATLLFQAHKLWYYKTMKLILTIDSNQEEQGLRITDRFITPDKEFLTLNREQQVNILRILKKDIEDLILKNDLITARQAGLN